MHRSPWRAWGALLLIALAAACGGGGGGVDTGGTGATLSSYSAGRISGFGSIIVNAVHFEDRHADIVDDDGVAHSRDELQLGMTVTIEAGPISSDSAGTPNSVAAKVEFGSEIRGPVESVEVAGNTLHVLGQTVKIDVNTVIAGFGGGLAGIHTGDIVQVFALFDATTGVYAATRIEHQGALPFYRLRGPIASLDTDVRTFKIGAATIGYATIAPAMLPGLANGTIAAVVLQTTPQSGRWIATRIRTPLPGIAEGTDTELEGFVTDFKSTADFKVSGVRVDASGAGVVFARGDRSQLANGARIEVEGHLQGGVLVATHIEVRQTGGGGQQQEQQQEFELRGAIQSVNLVAQSFVVRGTTVTIDIDTKFTLGSLSDIQVGADVEVKGVLSAGNQLRATKIKVGR
jgi:hypothetical protein